MVLFFPGDTGDILQSSPPELAKYGNSEREQIRFVELVHEFSPIASLMIL